MSNVGTWQAQSNVEPVSTATIGGIANIANYAVVSGCAPTYSAANLSVTVASGVILYGGVYTAVAGASVTLVADPTNPRWSWVGINSSGTPTLVSGTAAATPSVPDVGNMVPVTLVYVNAALTIADNSSYKLDKRVMGVMTYPSPAYAGMLQLGGGALTAPSLSTLTQTGRVMFCDFNATAISTGTINGSTDGVSSWLTSVHGGLVFYSSIAPSSAIATNAAILGITTGGARVVTLTGASGGAANFGLLSGYMQTQQGNSGASTSTVATLAPNRSPWMRVKMNPTSGGAANITTRQFGFFDSLSATANGAYLRRNTTGNLFFVTRQGGSETAVDLGAQTAAERWYDLYSPDAGVTWYYYDHTAATGGSQTTNVPTAATDLIVGHYVIQAAASQTSAFSRIAVSYIDN